MKNATYMMEFLERLAEGQEKGTIKAADAMEMNNTAGKWISLNKAALENLRLKDKTKGKLTIRSLEFDEEPPEKD
jgi:hypothetical protein